MQRLRTILAVTSVRLSIAYTLIFGLIAVFIIVYMTSSTVSLLRREIAQSINAEIVMLNRFYRRGGINGLVRQLERRASAPGANLYVIADPAGQIVAGNVRGLDPGIIAQDDWIRRPFRYARFEDTGERRHFAVARVVELPNGMRLLVGRDLGEPERYRKIVGRAFAFSLFAMFALGLVTWILVGRRALKRLDLVSHSTQRIMAGDRSQRLPVTGAGDEFDRLSVGLNGMLDRIQKLDEGLRQVSDNIAHDLKTPLTRLRNKADDALGCRDDKSREQALLEIIADTDQIIKTFNALLMISRVESGAGAAELKPVDLSAIAGDVVELYQPVAEERGFEVAVEIEPGLQVRGNRELLSQAMSNLIDNALKYGAADKPRLTISAAPRGAEAEICVADNGPGIDEANRARVTERFLRLEESRSQPGNGLGLSLVRAVAQLHDGMLEFSDAGPGLRACIRLPRTTSS